MIRSPLSPDRVRELTAHCRPAPKPVSNAGRRATVLTPEALDMAKRMIYAEGKTFKEAALAAGCSLSRLYTVLPAHRRARIGGAA